MERMLRLTQAEERTEDALTAAEQDVEDRHALIPAVRRQLGKAQATYKRAFDARTKKKNNSVMAGDWVHQDAHSRCPNKLGFKTQGPYMVLQTYGYRFLVESPTGLRTVSSAHVTSAPAPTARDAKWSWALKAQAHFEVGDQFKEGPEFVFDRFRNHGWDDEGQLKVLGEWFGFPEQKATWQRASFHSREAICTYCSRKRVQLPAWTQEGVFFLTKSESGP